MAEGGRGSVWIVSCVILAAAAPAFAQAPARPLASAKGQMAEVQWVRFETAAHAHRALPEGAKAGLVLEFAIRPTAKAPDGLFTMGEVRDVTLDGASYAILTSTSLGRKFEPKSLVQGLEKGGARPPDDGHAHGAALTVTLWGAQIPSAGVCTVTLEVGWNQQTEKLTLRVPMKSLSR